jgi:hypothetical protein
MRRQRKKDAAIKSNQGGIREFVIAYIRDGNGFYDQHESVSLTDLRKACAAAGKMSEFDGNCVFEEVMQNQYRTQLAQLDANNTFADDADESAERKREYAKYLLGRDLNETLFLGKQQLVALSLNKGSD